MRRRGELAEIQVIDTGIGIAGDKLNTVFHEFTRLDEGAREAEGLGLGLSIVDRIARVLRLEIRIFSNPGKGTRFSVILPVAAVPEPRREIEAKAPARAAASLAGLTVLCIDNDARILDGMRLLLEGWGCNVDTVSGSAGSLSGAGARPARTSCLPTITSTAKPGSTSSRPACDPWRGPCRPCWSPPTVPTKCAQRQASSTFR